MKLEIDLVAERRYQASVLGDPTLSPVPVGPEAYFVVIDGLFRMPIETKDAEALLKHMRYKASIGNGSGLSQAADRFRQAQEYNKAAYPPEANIYKASESDIPSIPDPPSDDDDEDDEEDDDEYAGTDDAGDGIGQY